MRVLFLAADAHLHRRARLLGKERRDDIRDRPRPLAPVTAAAVLADEHDVLRLDAQPAHHRHHRLHGALRRQVDEELAVLPVGHRRAALEALMAGVRRDERFVEDERRFLEAGLEVAVRPGRIGVLAHRQTARLYSSTSASVHFRSCTSGSARRLARHGRRTYPDVPFHAGIHRSRQQRRDRIHAERQRFPVDLDLFDRFSRRQFVDRRHSQNRFALIERLVGQRLLTLRVGSEWAGPRR